MSALDCIKLIDHTSLGDSDTNEKITQLTKEATFAAHDASGDVTTAAICIWPQFIKHAKSVNPNLKVATVVNFPKGQDEVADVVKLTQQSILDGVDEIDLVIDYKAILADKVNGAEKATVLCAAVKEACGANIPLKVILETGELATEENIRIASLAALKGHADTLKTSTGKVPVNATPAAAQVMLQAIADFHKETGAKLAGFKAAGGVKTLADAQVYLEMFENILGVKADASNFRFGASSLLKVLHGDLAEENKPKVEAAAGGAY